MAEYNSFFLITILILLLWSMVGQGSNIQLCRVERKLDAILKHLGIDMYPGVDSQILVLLREGKKIEAIKLYREATGVGLKEAKDFVESL